MPRRKAGEPRLAVNHFTQRLIDAGYGSVVRIGRGKAAKRYIRRGEFIWALGPLRIRSHSAAVPGFIADKYRDEIQAMLPGHAMAFIIKHYQQPDRENLQVVMSLESFEQILLWLIEYDKDRFIRVTTARGGME